MGLRWGLWVWSCPGVGDTQRWFNILGGGGGVGVGYFRARAIPPERAAWRSWECPDPNPGPDPCGRAGAKCCSSCLHFPTGGNKYLPFKPSPLPTG